jgi:DNA repair protein RecN (Recombination protein N)
MLAQLSISDFAIIKHLDLTLKPGLNILSGETGAGKSIIINAVNLILGGRASGDLIRSGCKEARVEALFAFPEKSSLKEMLSDFGLPFDGELLIKRTISHEGRNKILINGSLVTQSMLSRTGALLISISGQHEHQMLLRPDNHLYLLDDFGGLSGERSQVSELFRSYREIKEKILQLEGEVKETAEKHELSRFQIQEIERAGITPGEEATLLGEKRRLQHAEELLEIVSEGYQTLYESHGSVVSSIAQCQKRVAKGAEIEPELAVISEALGEARIKLEDASFALRDLQKKVYIDPQRLEQVLGRMELLHGLKRKYGQTLEDVMQFKERLSSMIYDLDEKKTGLKDLTEQSRAMERTIIDRAIILSQKRRKTAKALEEAIERELDCLHMQETRFRVKFDQIREVLEGEEEIRIEDIGPEGFDRMEFVISPNVGEDLKPLSKIASGGELSRIMLAAKTILARTGSVETIVFDEVDSGISGATAEVIGEKLRSLAGYHQILCITHLPQIAAQGQTHFLVSKEIVDKRTQTVISELDDEMRVKEIARLLGGRVITPSAIAHAQEMLG